MTGVRNVLEGVWLRTAGPILAGPAAKETLIRQAWNELLDEIGMPNGAFLLDTSYYKKTTLIGPVDYPGGLGFLKKHSDSSGAVTEKEKALLIGDLTTNLFRVARVTLQCNSAIVYELLPRSIRPLSNRRAEGLVFSMCERALKKDVRQIDFKNYLDLPHLTEWLSLHGRLDCQEAVNRAVAQIGGTRLVISHGDCTPWNMFADPSGVPCLVDYEDVAHRSPYFDFFHWHIQPFGLSRMRSGLGDFMEVFDPGQKEPLDWYVTYLMKMLEQDLRKRYVDGWRHPRLERMIRARADLLCDAFGSTFEKAKR